MIEPLKDDVIINKVGGRFKLTALIQKRWVELMQGARPTVDPGNMSELEIIVQEILQGKITTDFSEPPAPSAEQAVSEPVAEDQG
ncbi:MAG TPA: DNA-directed RNA polymerase subunit omega [Phycisphaerae bacterium]|jgi:DNA-directed RNA polymerase subunit omega|nr:DNA-directed RNA polymerase subunit omega [Phycisphaerae bacterium]HOB76088.1 DNA-directed RNA polymerase subunit omega [Phycisphaerae bacterium]HOJ55450.1 DNA-directed RNA polymerase subunit omega [Phycisphaerae bacterium]HOL25679.1 DNA-directed RNA polymerase subunit omega [Phycisphaerae bacterium]HPP19628.1 DNA-directed RNA polymerase subunit omega [Phycisphaerae bacterium]